MTETSIRELLAQLEQALRDLQDRGLFHGDLSPGNVLIDRNGRIRLLDFGLANSHKDLARLTIEFAAPERLSGEPATWAADLFSLGRLEQYMKGDPLTQSGANNYLHLSPEQRTARGEDPQTIRQRELGARVAQIQDSDRVAHSFRTQTQFAAKSNSSKSRALVAGLAVLFVSISSSASFHQRPLSPAKLNVRTKLWHHLFVNRRDVGYAPLEIFLPTETPIQIEWDSPLGHGQKHISLRPGQTLWLEDRDFSH
jgi:serine/threonine protein kinase